MTAETLLNEESEIKAGQTIGAYEILSLLGCGGMGEVYLALDSRLSRKVALKFLPASLTTDQKRLERFEREAHAASALNHPNIITIHEIGTTGAHHFIATEFIEGETLRARLSQTRLSLIETLRLAVQIADALAAAHKAGIIHRDIKPENIMLRPDGYVKVLDFGLAKLAARGAVVDAESPTRPHVRTETGVVMGTASYMSPEQARGLSVDERTDIWSLGCVLQEMLTGQSPFAGPTTGDIIVKVLEHEAPALAKHAPDAPAELQRIVSKALTKNRAERYQTITDLSADVKNLQRELDLADRPAAGATASKSFWRGRKSVALIALVGLLLMAGVVVLYKSLSRSPAAATPLKPDEPPVILATTQITFSPGLDSLPSLSPAGDAIAYSSDQNGSFEIYVKQLTPGGREIQLTTDGQQNSQPAWSPDGQRIAYYSQKRVGIWVIPTLGGTPRQLVEFGSRPAWSRDGSMIAFQSTTPQELGWQGRNAMPPSTIWTVPAQGGAPRQITKVGIPAGGHGAPAWSPDRKRIVFDTSDFGSAALWSVSLADGAVKRIVPEGHDGVYAPDGENLYYINDALTLKRIRLSPATGEPVAEAVRVAGAPPTMLRFPTISADGKRLAYNTLAHSSSLWSIPLSPVTNRATGPPASFTREKSHRETLPRFSPDGQRFAFNRWRLGTSTDIWVADADGENETQLTASPATDSQASWFPAGDKIAFLSNRDNNHLVLWAVTLASRKEEPLLDLGAGVEYGQLSPDGKQFAFNSKKSGTINIWVASLDGGEPKQLTFDDELMGFPCWSPDGQFLAFEIKRGDDTHLAIIPSGGGTPTQLTFERGHSWPHSWSSDGSKIAFAGLRDGIWNIYWVSRDGKTQQQVTNSDKLNAFVRYPAWSPRGDKIVYEYSEITGNIWLIDLK